MDKLIRFSMKNTGAMILAILMILAGGFYSASSMKLEEMPNVDIPYLTVVVPYPGATPEQALNDVGKSVEQALAGLDGLKNLYITARSNAVTATLEFDLEVSMKEAEKDVNSTLSSLKFPDGVQKPTLYKNGPGAVSIFSFAVMGPGDVSTIEHYVNEEIKPLFSTIQGISSVDVSGVAEKKLFVRLDPEKIKEENLTVDQIKQALLANNISIPAGQVDVDGKNLNVEISKKITSIEDLKNTEIVIIEQDMSGLTNAFTTMGNAMGELGKGVGQLTKAEMMLQAQIKMMQAIDGLSKLYFKDQLELIGLKGLAKVNPEDESLPPRIAELEQKVKTEKEQIEKMQSELAALQKEVEATGADVSAILKKLSQSGLSQKEKSPVELKIKTLTIGSIADVRYETERETSITRLNGKPAVITGIKSQPGTNTVEIIEQINEKLDQVNLPEGYELVKLHDGSVSILESVNGMLREALLGAFFAMLVTLLFLRNLRSTLVAIISIPLSVFVSIIFLKMLDYSFNIMTLSGMAVAVGRVVDDSIVVIENIYRHLKGSTERSFQLILDATKEVGGAVTSSTLTTIGVFAPLSFVSGIVGKFFVPFAVTVVVSILFSLIVAMTVVPLMARLFLLKIEPHEPKENALQRIYRKSLNWSLKYRKTVFGIALLLFVGSMALIPIIPKNFLPQEKTDSYGLSVSMPIGTALDRSNQVAKEIEEMLQGNKYVKYYQTYLTGEDISIQIKLHDTVNKQDNQIFEEQVRKELTKLPSDITSALTPQGLTSYGGGLYLVLNGTDIDTLKKAGDQIVAAIKDTPGLTDVSTNLTGGRSQIFVDVDPVKAAEKGLNPAMLAMTIRQMIDGDSVTKVSMNGRTTEIEISLDVGKLDSITKIGEQLVTNMTGEKVRVSEVATVSEKPGPTSIQRLNQKEYVSVSGRFTTDNTSQVQKDVEKKIETMNLPKGVNYYFEGEAEALNDGFTSMTISILVAILLVYMIMMVTFGEMIAPLAILFSLPFIFVGGIIGMFIFNQALGMPALVGFLMLVGIVVTNAIVLVDRVLKNRSKGMSLYEALIEAGVTRLRPILMTAVATIGALMPLAIFGQGGVISRSLAVVVICGLTTSTLLTLIIVPVAYSLLVGLRERLLKKGKENIQPMQGVGM